MNARPLVIVILSCNQTEITLECLRSLEECSYTDKQIILVDNGSDDDVEGVVRQRFADVIVLRNPENIGAAGGRNTGIEYAVKNADFRYILFMDNDIVVAPDFLSRLVDGLEACENPAVEIASPLLYQMGREDTIDSAGGVELNYFTGSSQRRGHGKENDGQYEKDELLHCVPTTAVLMHRRALERAGGYDVSFDPFGYEDIDMVLRANSEGVPFLFVPAAVGYHRGSKTGFSGYTAEYARVKGQNMRRFFKRYSTSFQWVCFNLLLPFLGIRTILRELRRGNVKVVANLAKGLLSGGK